MVLCVSAVIWLHYPKLVGHHKNKTGPHGSLISVTSMTSTLYIFSQASIPCFAALVSCRNNDGWQLAAPLPGAPTPPHHHTSSLSCLITGESATGTRPLREVTWVMVGIPVPAPAAASSMIAS